MTKGYIHSTETFGSADGPGVRFIIFTAGCPMRCRYCHNPDTWKTVGAKQIAPSELVGKAMRFRPYWGTDGGITVSGGEPLFQPDFLIELCECAKDEGITIAIDTSGQPFSRTEPDFSKFARIVSLADLFLLDIKHIDDERHKSLTGCSNKSILDFARFLSDAGKPVWIRHVLVPGRTDDEESLLGLKSFIDSLENVDRVEVLKYHTLGVGKWEELGIPYALRGVREATDDDVRRAEKLLGVSR